MVSRLMFSLRKTAAKQAKPWAISARGNYSMRALTEVETIRFAYWFDVSHETSGALAPPNGEVIELGSRFSWDRGSQ